MSYAYTSPGAHYYSLQPVSSPSEHSLFSVHSLSSSSSSIISQNEKAVSSTPSSINSNLGSKIKKALSRSNSVNKDFEPVTKKIISNPVPITKIPVRKGSVDLKYFNLYDDNTLKNNTNYYFHHDRSHSVPEAPLLQHQKQASSGQSRSKLFETPLESDEDDFYFTETSGSSPFDVIFNERSTNFCSKPIEMSSPGSSIDLDDTPIAPLNIRTNSSITEESGNNKRASAASTIKLNRQSINYRSSRITLSHLRTTASSSPRSLEFSLFSPAKDNFGNNSTDMLQSVERSLNRLNGQVDSKRNNRISIHNSNFFSSKKLKNFGDSTFNRLKQRGARESIQINTSEAYELEGLYEAHELASDILNRVGHQPLLGSRMMTSWI
ncbi:hypothetical protein DASC09_016310 [Saccharomycopsis crataegensis]|uniref:Uncharacterized protein n=1 Tax=Saccharomycopsis crataegensis TaxID=43959 RepID=A0AAV5QI57_9ASCO|nr:hypothetical protein DASC09_016310 [Saccharomycopsis crataegensis]